MITHAPRNAPGNAPGMPNAMRQAMRREPGDAMHVRDVRDVLTIFLTASDQLTVGNARENRNGKSAMSSPTWFVQRHDDPTTMAPADYFAVLRRFEWARILTAAHAPPPQPQRHGVLRTGPRPEIPAHVRVAVYLRDARMCTICQRSLSYQTKHLDHIHPWSAGGSDRSHNLRTTCPQCNQTRSNWDDGTARVQPVTWWCTDCWSTQRQRHIPWADQYGQPGWRERMPVIEPEHVDLVLAYCAACRGPGHTTSDRVL